MLSIATAAGMLLLASCTVLPVEQARRIKERERGSFDLSGYVASAWERTRQDLDTRAVPLSGLDRSALDKIGAERGNRAGEGSPWTFLVTGDGVVRTVNIDRPKGSIELDTAAGPVVLQAGPVVSGTAVRDALPSVTFNDVSDQIAFAEVGLALTDRALQPLASTIKSIAPGDRIRFAGAASIGSDNGPVMVTPIRIARHSAEDGAR